jgi:thiamine biosynthesis lipoprotein
MTPNQRNNIIYSLILIGSMAAVFFYRKYQASEKAKLELGQIAEKTQAAPDGLYLYQIQGETMGTTYQIKYRIAEKALSQSTQVALKNQIDSLLEVFNLSLSTYIPNSEISRFNQFEKDSIHFFLPYFYPVLKKSKEIYELSAGAFDPTLSPLIRVWGFGEMPEPEKIPTTQIDSLLQYVGFDKIEFDSLSVRKKKKGMSLNFNAIAQGYGVDVVCDFLSQKGFEHYMVEIGGEVRAKGTNGTEKGWLIGIDDPNASETERLVKATVLLQNAALVTSGNYRKFYIREGKKYAHTLDPTTGYPTTHNLLSATILAKDCMTADALATVCMVLGREKGEKLLSQYPDSEQIGAYFIVSTDEDTQTFTTPVFKKILKVEEN